MKKIYKNDGPMIFAADGKFYIKGHRGNELLYIDSEGQEGSIFVTGNTGSSIDGKGGEVGPGPEPVIPIAPMTLRFAFSQESSDPSTLFSKGGPECTKLDNYPGYSNVWDLTFTGTNWNNILNGNLKSTFDPDIKLIAAGDTSNVTSMEGMFRECNSLTSVALFDTSNVTDMEGMFYDCSSLTSIPLFNTGNVTNMNYMIQGCRSLTTIPQFDVSNVTDLYYAMSYCRNIESGMLDFYRRASSTGKVGSYAACFENSGIDTESGRAERAQIPQSWLMDVE